jgi:hypothetical protein
MHRGQSFAGGTKVAASSGDYASQNLGIHEDLLGNVFVKDLAVIPVSTPEVRPGAVFACCLLPAACCLLPAACCLLPAACCLLPAACCLCVCVELHPWPWESGRGSCATSSDRYLHAVLVPAPQEVVTVMRMGFRLRATHETKMNAVSSRSHTVFTINIIQKGGSFFGGEGGGGGRLGRGRSGEGTRWRGGIAPFR